MKNALIVSLLMSTLPLVAAAKSEYIMKFRDGYSAQFLSSKATSGTYARVHYTSLGNFAVIESYDSKRAYDVALELMNRPEVEYIEPNYTYYMVGGFDGREAGEWEDHRPISYVEDRDFSKQWGMYNSGKNSGSTYSPGKMGEDISMLDAWNVSEGSKDVIVAVIDTGVDYTHSDLKRNLWVNQAEALGQPGVDDDMNGYVDDIHGYDFANKDGDPMDDQGHGTHCAGVIGASHNATGVRGVMNYVRIMPLKFLTAAGSGTLEDAVLAIDYAVKMGAHVLSNSWGGGPISKTLQTAIEGAGKAGIIFVAAAGNENNDNDKKPSYPASYNLDNVVSVGAFTGKGARASFSNYGAKSVHVFAPGENTYSTMPKEKYASMSGTSMACPHVSGIVGLMLSEEPNLTPSEIKTKLIRTSVPTTALEKFSASKGRVNAYRALSRMY